MNPSTGEVFSEIPAQSETDFNQCISELSDGFSQWRLTSFKERKKGIHRLRQVIINESDTIAERISLEQGKPLTEAFGLEILPVLGYLKFLENSGESFFKSFKFHHHLMIYSHKTSGFTFEPFGPVLVIGPWNFPFSIPVIGLAQALFCGNTVVVKPSPFTASIGLMIGELLEKADIRKEIAQIFICEDSVAPFLTEHRGVKKIIFTGSTATGKKVMSAASKNLTPVLLELGGKDPVIVSEHANIEKAVDGIMWGSLANAGQVCASSERIYVHKKVAQQVTRKIVEKLKQFSVENSSHLTSQMGPIIHDTQRQLIMDHIKDAVNKGAKIEYGGNIPQESGSFISPTVLSLVTNEMDVMKKETFGPVIAIQEIESFEEGLKLANQSEYGLTATLWSNDSKEIDTFISKVEAGVASVNDTISSFAEPMSPWGGVKQSGIGRSHSIFGLLEMVQVKFYSIDKNPKPNLWWYPYNEESLRFMKSAIRALYSTRWREKISSTWSLITNRRFLSRVYWWSIVKGIRRWF